MVFVRDMMHSLDSVVARSRKLQDEPDGPYYIMYQNISQARLHSLQEMGIVGKQPRYVTGRKSSLTTEGWTFKADERGHEYAFYPVDFDRADYCLDQLDRIITDNETEGLKRWRMSIDEILSYGRTAETTE